MPRYEVKKITKLQPLTRVNLYLVYVCSLVDGACKWLSIEAEDAALAADLAAYWRG